MPQYLPLPNGAYLELREGESPEAGYQRAQEKYPDAFAAAKPAAKPESGFMPALRAGATELGGGISALMGRTGLKDTAQAQAEYEAAQKRAREIFKPTEAGWTEAPVTKFAELLGGSLPYMAAPLAAGAAAATLPLTGAAATVAGLGAAGLASATQFTATNLARQLEEGKKLTETDLGAAALAAVPQAALDTLSMRMIPGIGRLFGQAGIKVTAENAKEIAEQALKKTLLDYTVKTGKTAGIEGATEAAQQVFERLQAGLSITDEKAREEYFENFIGGAVLGGTLSVPGRYAERSKAQREARGMLEADAAAQAKAAADAEAAKKASPDYILDIASQYEALNKQKADLVAQIAKGTKEAPLTQEARDRNTLIQQQLKELEPQIAEQRKTYLAAGGPDAVKKAREQVLELTPPPAETPAAAEEAEAPEVRFARAEREVKTLSDLLEQQREQLSQATTPEDALTLAQRVQKTQTALEQSQAVLAERPKVPDTKKLEAQLAKAQAAGDQEKVIKYAQQLIEARKQAPVEDLGLFDPARMVAEEERLRALGEAMGAGREAAGYERTQAEIEQQAAREQAQRREALQQQLELEGTAEREAMQELAASRASTMRARELEPLRTAPQLAMFPEGTSIETRPQGPLAERLNTLAERALAAPRVDEQTKDLIRQVQDNLPALVQRDPQQTGAWLYRTLQGTAPADLTQNVRAQLAELEAGRRSETERTSTGEIRRAVQTELGFAEPAKPPRPQPPIALAKAFDTFEQFNQYLGSDALRNLKAAHGQLEPTVARVGNIIAPMQQKVDALRSAQQELTSRIEALNKANVQERATAQTMVDQARAKLQRAVDDISPVVASKGPGGRETRWVNLEEAKTQAEQRLSDALTQAIRIGLDMQDNVSLLKRQIDNFETGSKPVMVDAQGRATEDATQAVRTVPAARLPGLQKLRQAQLALQAAIAKVTEADQRVAKVVQSNLGQSWAENSPEFKAYTAAKKEKEDARRAAQQAHHVLLKANAAIPSAPKLSSTAFSKFLMEDARLYDQFDTQLKRLNGYKLSLRNVRNRLNDVFVAAQQNPETAQMFQRLRQDVLAGDQITQEAAQAAQQRTREAEGLRPQVAALGEQARPVEAQVERLQREAVQRAEARRKPVPTGETLAEREARDAAARREEQARLERQEAMPATRVEFERAEPENRELRKFAERLREAPTAEQRAAVRKELEEYLQSYVQRKDAALEELKRKAAKNLQDVNKQRKAVAELTEKLKGDMTPNRRESAEKQLAEAKRKLEEHQRRYTLNTREMKITRTDVQAQREARNRLLAESSGRRVEGERLGVAEGTFRRATGPVTRPGIAPPRTLRTGTEESRAGETTTPGRMRYSTRKGELVGEPVTQESRTPTPRDTAVSRREMAEAQAEADRIEAARKQAQEANKIAEELKQKKAEPKEAVEEATEEAVEAAPKKLKKLTKAQEAEQLSEQEMAAIEEMEVEEDFEPEIAGTFEFGPQDTLFSRGPTENPSTAGSVRAELGKVFPDLGRVKIFDSVDALIEANPQYEGRIPSDARGFVDPKTNQAFLIAENIEQGRALSVLLHEVGSHIGLKNALGEAQYNALVNAVKSWEKRNDGSIESRVAQVARERVEAAQTTPGQVNDELLAYAIEEAVNAGVKPTETKGPIGQWLSRVAALLRKTLEKFGLPPKALDAQGLVDMAFGAAKLEMQEDGMLPTPKRERSLMDIVPRLQKETGTPIGLSGFIADTSAPFNNMTFAEAARFGLKSAKGETKKLLFQKLVDVFEQAPEGVKQGLVLATNGMRNKRANYMAAFNPDLNRIYTPHTERNGWLDTMLHELTHAATYYGLSTNKELNSQVEDLRLRVRYWTNTPEGKRKARSIFNLVNPETKEIYGLKNTDEFVAETFSNRAFQKLLALIPSDKPAKSLFTKFVEAVSNAIGLTSPKERTALAEAIALTEEAMDTTAERVYAKPEKLPAQRTRTVGAEDILFSRNLPTASRVADALIAAEPTLTQRIKDSFNGFRTQFIDKLFPAEEALKRGKVDETKAMQANYYLRMYDQRNHFVSQAIATGAPELRELTRPDARKERLIEAKPGANISQVVDILKQPAVAKAAGSPDAANKLFTLYLAGLRAKRVGIDTLNFGGKVKQADLDAAMAEIEANDTLKNAFSEARAIYNQYNKDLINFAVEAGSIGKDHAKRLLANDDYIPYYRVRDGVAQMIIGKETPVRIGNLKDSPHLQELVGGDEAIFDFLTSSVQNTAMLLDMSMRNLATKNLMYELRDVGLATISKEVNGNAPSNAVTFKKDGVDHFAIVNTDAIGIDSDLLVKGLAGIPTMFPSFVRVMGIPARFLRRMVVASPVYMARQLFRDSLAGSIASGANMVPVLDALKQIGKPGALERRGITGGQVFTGMPEDITNMLKDMQAGKISLTSGLGWLEAKSAAADALTRRAQYESYRKQGLSEMEATLMSLESMNFSRRGLSPTVHMVSTLIPFLNSQIQSLDVLYRAFTGKMPMNERLDIRRKLFERGMMLAGLSFAYAAAMGDDDEAYKNARPEEKYGNWFVPIPGMQEPLRVPIPFEIGYIFKALPEAIVNTMRSKEGGEEALKALKYITVQTIPGASSYFVPQAVKPAMETLLDRSFFTGRELESAREKMLEPGYRARDNTTELAKWLGEATNVSPIKMENLVRGYTGGMGMAFLQALSAPLAGAGPEPAAKRVTDLPVIGTLFQPADASGIVDAVYEKVNDARKIQATYKDMLAKGRVADAQAYLNKHVEEQAAMAVEGSFRQQMAKIMQYEQSIRVSSMTPQEKRDALDKAKQAKITLASAVREMLGRTTPQAARP